MNGQPWHFILVDRPEALEGLARVAPTGRFIAQAGMAIAVAINKTEYAVSDASRAIQSMILTAWSEGVASNWAGFFRLDEAKILLGIPDQMDLLAIVAFGYAPTSSAQGRKKRRALSEVAHYGRFGNPLAAWDPESSALPA
jgi:nitroreductase